MSRAGGTVISNLPLLIQVLSLGSVEKDDGLEKYEPRYHGYPKAGDTELLTLLVTRTPEAVKSGAGLDDG